METNDTKENSKPPKRVFLNTLFVLILIIIFGVGLFSNAQITKFSDATRLVIHTYQVMQATNKILLGVYDVESATRGYLIIDDKTLIENIDEKIKFIFDNLALSTNLTLDNPNQQKRLALLEPLLKARIKLIRESIQIKEKKRSSSYNYKDIILSAQGITKQIKTIIQEMHDQEIALLEQREEAAITNLNTTLTTANLADIITLIFLGILIFLFNRMLLSLFQSKKNAQESSALLKNVVEGTNDIIAAFDLNYNLLMYNDAFAKEFRAAFGKRVTPNMNLKEALAHLPKEQEKALAIWDRALQGEEFTVIQEFGVENLSRNAYEITFSSLYNDQGKLIGASHIMRNISKRLEEQQTLEQANKELESAFQKLEIRANEITLVNDMDNALKSCSSMEETLNMIAIYLKKLLPFGAGIIYLMNSSRNYLEAMKHWNHPIIKEKTIYCDQCWGLRQGKIYFYLSQETNIPCKHIIEHKDIPSYLCIPLLGQNEVIGLLYVELLQNTNAAEQDLKNIFETQQALLQNITSQIALSISNMKLHDTLKTRSTRDALTNLYNRGYLIETLTRDLQRSKRNKSSLAVVMLDVDFFKTVNDQYGHEAGDIVLHQLSKTLQLNMRESDLVCRYGGEEFLLVLYDAAAQDTLERIEQLRQIISTLEFNFSGTPYAITASFGIAIYPEQGEGGVEKLINRADKALYQSKKEGRNKITLYSPSLEGQ